MLSIAESGRLLILVVLLSCHLSSDGRETFSTIGKRTCATWNEDLKKSKGTELHEKLGYMFDTTWLFGFASGVNYLADTDLLDQIDAALLKDWTTKYCQENPDRDIASAAASLLVEARKVSETEKKERRSKQR